MRILLACEESQEGTKAFRAKGHEAFSCDKRPCSGGHPEWHIQADAIKTIESGNWDKVISFPPCTDLTVAGARWFNEKRLDGRQRESIRFFMDLWTLSDAVENPRGIMSGWSYLKSWFPDVVDLMEEVGFPKEPSQTIHPWQFGHRSSKATCLWLHNLPKLVPTNIVGPPKRYVDMSPSELKEWTSVHRCPPGPQRTIIRSKTYSGIAQAMAHQWG
jgi:hypothetical protein